MDRYSLAVAQCSDHVRGAKQGGGVSIPPEFWMEGMNTCQPPPPDFEKFFLGGVGSP